MWPTVSSGVCRCYIKWRWGHCQAVLCTRLPWATTHTPITTWATVRRSVVSTATDISRTVSPPGCRISDSSATAFNNSLSTALPLHNHHRSPPPATGPHPITSPAFRVTFNIQLVLFVFVLQCLWVFLSHFHSITHISVAGNSYKSFVYVLQMKLFADDVQLAVVYTCKNRHHKNKLTLLKFTVYIEPSAYWMTARN